MEEENKIGAETIAAEQSNEHTSPAEVEQKAEPVAAQFNATAKNVTSHIRKNGRNRSGSRNSSATASNSTESCGEVSDLSAFKEKLSGSNASGYVRPERAERTFEKREAKEARKIDEPSNSAETVAANETEQSEPEAAESNDAQADKSVNGPSFETKKFTPRAIEVPLSDKRIKGDRQEKSVNGPVSYSPGSVPPVSLFTRIKEAIKAIFGGSKKSKGKKDFRSSDKYKKGDRKFKNERREGKGGYNNYKGNGNRRGYNGKKRYNNNERRHSSNNRGSSGGNAS